MRILAFDIGSTGAMCAINRGAFRVRTIRLNAERRCDKFVEYNEIVAALMIEFQPTVIVYERPFARGLPATRMLWGFAEIVERLGCEYGAVVDQVPSAIKKWATGNGNAKKAEMIDIADLMGYTPANDHEADAYLLALYTQATVISEGPTT